MAAKRPCVLWRMIPLILCQMQLLRSIQQVKSFHSISKNLFSARSIPTCNPNEVSRGQFSRTHSVRFASTDTSSTSSPASTNKVRPMLPVVGDFAGLSADFTPSGDLIPIPEHYIPKSLLEWGQEPSCFEVLLSENPDNSRQIVTVLPETGCAIDNMDTLKNEQNIEPLNLETTTEDEACPAPRVAVVRDVSTAPATDKVCLEATFWDPTSFEEDMFHRTRVLVTLQHDKEDGPSTFKLANPVRIIMERFVTSKSTKGTIADGGGLDGQRVSKWLGPYLRKRHSFAEKPSNLAPRSPAPNDMGTRIMFPGNISLTCGTRSDAKDSSFFLEICHVSEELDQTVRMWFQEANEKPTTVESWIDRS